jgi:hypothetical protein
MKLVRKDPPKKNGGSKVWPAILDQVAAEGGVWLLVRTCADSRKAGAIAGQVRDRWNAGGRFEIVSRGREIYARLKTK